ncbi:CYTH and CHAD domain-containing protein [Candidatus Mycobacterium methanotrophicum]|uniref:CYTH and CHAD domain-containing protein n=1 Tax=Candidatus Mycobacterium methanotrophicum TaxID=2943498 RepID=A0ABY4QGB7_9MYCO|nr:CYTH and CHAD domain-containing protein [Candidatus Mycobacterium methanotrophicum]UQX09527.1 CYTH and CHAD domain-containing protein [Candidatus Mycobacterium methanotrophicum]
MSDGAPSTSRYLEVERKFDVGESTSPPSFAGVPEIHQVERLPTQELDAVYFDTPARDLASRRITLRRRTGGVDAGWHLKLPAGPDARTEVREPLGSDEESHHDVPTELVDVVLAIVRDRPLNPVARITTTRAVQRLYDADDAVLAEFCDDQVIATRAATPDAPEVEQRWREWELELTQPETNTALLDTLSDRLLGAGARPAGHGSKLARVLGTRPKDCCAADPLHRAVAEQFDELLVWDRAVRTEADDAVHQMRVTTRQIRSLLQASSDLFVLPDGLLGELRELANVLGVARDAEVLAGRYRNALDALPPELIRGPIRERLVDDAEHRYRAGLRHSLAALRSPRYFRLLDALETVIATAPSTGQRSAPVAVAAAGKKVRRAAKAAQRAGDEDRDSAIHRIRKRAKRLRYTAAATGAKKVSKRAKKIQSLLGDHQDSAVSREHLIQQAEATHVAGEDTFTYGLLYQQETDLAVQCRRQLRPALRKLDKSLRKLPS